MKLKGIVVLALAVALFLPAAASAHTGHVHKVMGTVTAVTATQLDVKTTDGKTVIVVLDGKTTFKQGTAKAGADVVKIGERVVVSALQPTGSKTMTATIVQVAKAPVAKAPAAPAKKTT
jgi:ferric-dicitrate binding protein FerR (iron transport regulator)